MKHVAVSPRNFGWVEAKLDSHHMDYVWKCIENKRMNVKSTLAGHIDSSYALLDETHLFYDEVLYPLIVNYTQEYDNLGNDLPTNQMHPYHLSKWWVNYQKQGEFNPLHDHSGVYSFVLWMKIPTDFNEQNNNPLASESNTAKISVFEFQYLDILGNIKNYTYQLSKENEGVLVLFPASLKHCVYPFYNCDEERISVSGNIGIDTRIVL